MNPLVSFAISSAIIGPLALFAAYKVWGRGLGTRLFAVIQVMLIAVGFAGVNMGSRGTSLEASAPAAVIVIPIVFGGMYWLVRHVVMAFDSASASLVASAAQLAATAKQSAATAAEQ